VAKKVGAYICTGCGIGDDLDIEALAKVATKEKKLAICKNHPFLCGSEGCELIKQDIQEGLDGVVIAACSQRVNTDVFNFGPSVVVERVNLREQCIWCHPANDEDTQMLAEDQLRMGSSRPSKWSHPNRIRPRISPGPSSWSAAAWRA
jgi:quinone-modifying oxidoreductase subunit QmoB